ncbi:hypothetical protein BDW22DRAFT_1358406 [Trametopsis cervina]|nr:hypothetical protein BDW22DRAFT_1358406 [Trametopsis cervina]
MSSRTLLRVARPPFASSRAPTRSFQSTALRRDLVGPNDPISNLRPVIYDDAVPTPPDDVRHPYSLREFRGDTREYQWRLQRQELDAFNHTFWTDSNTRFEAAKESFLSSLPESCTEDDKEHALATFYRSWLLQEEPRQRAYNAEWQRRNNANIVLGAKLQYRKFMARLGF